MADALEDRDASVLFPNAILLPSHGLAGSNTPDKWSRKPTAQSTVYELPDPDSPVSILSLFLGHVEAGSSSVESFPPVPDASKLQ